MTQQNATPGKKGAFNILDNSRNRMIFAVVMAVVAWVFITVGVITDTDKVISHVPVNFTYDAERYTALGLSIVNNPSSEVSLKVYGDGADIGNLNANDFLVYPRYTSQLTAGSVDLGLHVRCVANGVDTSNMKVTLQPEDVTVTVVFDTVEEKRVPVRIEKQNLAVAEGYILDRSATAPSEVLLTGPTSELQNVAEAVAEISSDSALDRTVTITKPLKFLDAAGEEVQFTYVTPSVEKVDVILTVYKQAELPLVVSMINKPAGFDESLLRCTLSQKTLHVAGPAAVVDSLTELSVGTIDLSTFALDKVYEMPVQLPNGLVSQENVSSVTVSFDTSALTTKKLNLSSDSVQVVNLPASYSLEVITERLRNVVLCGPAEVLNTLTPESVVAQIDADGFNIVTGQQNIAVKIYVPASNQVFALGNYSVVCQIESQ